MKSGRERLREWVERSKVGSQRAAADLLGVHKVVLNQWLSGVRTPDLDNAHLIERVTGIGTESWLLTDESKSDESHPADSRKAKAASR